MFSFLINFVTLASVIGEVIGVFGTMAAIAEIYLYDPNVKIDGGVAVE